MDAEIVLFDGFEELDAVGPYEVLAIGGVSGADVDVAYGSLGGATTIRAGHGTRLESDGDLGHTEPDLVIVPGGGWNDRAEAGTWAEAERGALPDCLAELHEQGVTVAGVCTGGMLLSRAGLLSGRPAVTHQGAIDDLRATDADVVEARVVDAGDVLTSGGVTAGLDLGLHLLERDFGEALAEGIATEMEYQRRGPVHVA